MVTSQLAARKITDQRILNAMAKVPRHLFVSSTERNRAYGDHPLPIGHGQTISQPYIVASMTQELRSTPTARVLEIGTGCGYQTAVLAEIVKTVYSLEVVAELHRDAQRRLTDLGYRNTYLACGDGSVGWPEQAPFDGILVTAAAPRIPEALVEQLTVGGVMVIPVGPAHGPHQDLLCVTRTDSGYTQTHLYGVRFVPMVGAIAEL